MRNPPFLFPPFAKTMAPKISPLLLFSIAVVTSALAYSPSPAIPPGGGDSNSTEFIRACCAATLYPDLCFASLAPYAGDVRRSPVAVAHLAVNVTSVNLRHLSARVAALRRASPAGDPQEAAALRDCGEAVGDAADQARRSAEEIGRLDEAEGPEVAWEVSNCQTWMSAAMTNEETCADGFAGVGPTPAKAEVCRRIRRVKQYTSNALALINSLVNSR